MYDDWVVVALHASLSLAFWALVGTVVYLTRCRKTERIAIPFGAVVFWCMFLLVPFFYVPAILGLSALILYRTDGDTNSNRTGFSIRRITIVLLMILAVAVAILIFIGPSIIAM